MSTQVAYQEASMICWAGELLERHPIIHEVTKLAQ